MPFYSDYKCTACGCACLPEDLLRKKVDFVTLGGTGRRSRVVRSRTVAWLCKPCVQKDPAYNVESHNTPGMQSPARNRVRAAEERSRNGGTAGHRAQEPAVQADGEAADSGDDAGGVPLAVHDSGTSGG